MRDEIETVLHESQALSTLYQVYFSRLHAEIHTKKVGNESKLIIFEVLVVSSNTASNKESNLRKHLFCPTVNVFHIFALWFSAKILQDHIWL